MRFGKTVKLIKQTGGYSSGTGTLIVELKGKKYTRKTHWHQVGRDSSTGYPYVVVNGVKHRIKET